MKIFKFVLIVGFILSLFTASSSIAAFELKECPTYEGYTSDMVTFAWDQDPAATGYELRLFNVDRNAYIATAKTTNTQLPFRLPKTGMYVVEVRSCNDEYKNCSEWSASTNSSVATVNGQPECWRIYGRVAPAGPITIGR